VTGQEACIVCAGTLTRMTVLALDAAAGLAECADERGAASTVDVALLGEVAPGEVLLVHAGAALAREDGAEAQGAGAPGR